MMNAEQKQAAQNLIDDFKGAGNEWDEAAVASHMAALLQELVDAQKQAGVPYDEPVAAQARYMAVRVGLPSYGNSGFGPWQPAPMPKEGALLKGVDSVGYAYEIRLLYAAPQAPAVQTAEYLRADLAEKQRDKLLAALELIMERMELPPDTDCYCHISPPCHDCVENSGIREAIELAESTLAEVKGDK